MKVWEVPLRIKVAELVGGESGEVGWESEGSTHSLECIVHPGLPH